MTPLADNHDVIANAAILEPVAECVFALAVAVLPGMVEDIYPGLENLIEKIVASALSGAVSEHRASVHDSGYGFADPGYVSVIQDSGMRRAIRSYTAAFHVHFERFLHEARRKTVGAVAHSPLAAT